MLPAGGGYMLAAFDKEAAAVLIFEQPRGWNATGLLELKGENVDLSEIGGTKSLSLATYAIYPFYDCKSYSTLIPSSFSPNTWVQF